MPKPLVHAILPDVHIDSYDPLALECALKIVEYVKPDTTVLLGDFIDAYAWSAHAPKFVKADKKSYIDTEINVANPILDRIQESTKKKLVYIEGNHEFRVQRWCANNEPYGVGSAMMETLAPRVLLSRTASGRLRKRFEWVPYDEYLSHYEVVPNLWCIHGWSVAKNAARAHLNKAKTVSLIYGHTHRADQVSENILIDGRIVSAWSDGCLCDLKPEYMMHTPHDWTQGMTILYQSRNRPEDWTPVRVQIRKGRAILGDGTEIKA